MASQAATCHADGLSLWLGVHMTRMFLSLNRINFSKIPTALEMHRALDEAFNPAAAACVQCGAVGFFTVHAGYGRYFVDYYGGSAHDDKGEVVRYRCGSCGGTHAALADCVAPHKTYSLPFILRTLKEYLFRKLNGMTVAKICEKYGMAVTTLYGWVRTFLSHRALDIGALESILAPTKDDKWLAVWPGPCSLGLTLAFFERFGFSFLQFHKISATQSSGP